MKLTFDQIKASCTGAVSVEQESDGFHFYRFTRDQMTLCQPHVVLFDKKLLVAAGVRLSFRTDSRTLFLRATVTKGSARSYFSFDLMVNGVHTDSMENFSHLDLPGDQTALPCTLGTFEKAFPLGPGEKDICLYFPWSVVSVLQELSLDYGARVTPLLPPKKLLVYGDSISQGYDALHPCGHHVARLARALNAQEFNKAIGGAISFPEMARMKDPMDPDYVLVAYGTNDWSLNTPERFLSHYDATLAAIHSNYPAAQVFAITPIWRKDMDKATAWESFSCVERYIKQLAAPYPNVTVISGLELVPHDESYFADLRLHPNDAGFAHYFNNLWPQIKAVLKE